MKNFLYHRQTKNFSFGEGRIVFKEGGLENVVSFEDPLDEAKSGLKKLKDLVAKENPEKTDELSKEEAENFFGFINERLDLLAKDIGLVEGVDEYFNTTLKSRDIDATDGLDGFEAQELLALYEEMKEMVKNDCEFILATNPDSQARLTALQELLKDTDISKEGGIKISELSTLLDGKKDLEPLALDAGKKILEKLKTIGVYFGHASIKIEGGIIKGQKSGEKKWEDLDKKDIDSGLKAITFLTELTKSIAKSPKKAGEIITAKLKKLIFENLEAEKKLNSVQIELLETGIFSNFITTGNMYKTITPVTDFHLNIDDINWAKLKSKNLISEKFSKKGKEQLKKEIEENFKKKVENIQEEKKGEKLFFILDEKGEMIIDTKENLEIEEKDDYDAAKSGVEEKDTLAKKIEKISKNTLKYRTDNKAKAGFLGTILAFFGFDVLDPTKTGGLYSLLRSLVGIPEPDTLTEGKHYSYSQDPEIKAAYLSDFTTEILSKNFSGETLTLLLQGDKDRIPSMKTRENIEKLSEKEPGIRNMAKDLLYRFPSSSISSVSNGAMKISIKSPDQDKTFVQMMTFFETGKSSISDGIMKKMGESLNSMSTMMSLGDSLSGAVSSSSEFSGSADDARDEAKYPDIKSVSGSPTSSITIKWDTGMFKKMSDGLGWTSSDKKEKKSASPSTTAAIDNSFVPTTNPKVTST